MSRPSLLAIVLFASASLLVGLLQSANGAKADVVDHNSQQDTTGDQIPGIWLSDLFYRALANFTLGRANDMACRRQSAVYEAHLSNHTSWAVRMQESWDRYPVGLLAGNTYQMGVYDECVDIRHPVKGQYCLSEIKVIPPAGRDYSFIRTEDLDDFGQNHAWKTVLGWSDRDYQDQVQRNILRLGVCIPSACSALDLQTTLQSNFDEAFPPEQFKTVVRVDPIMCRVREDMYPYDTSYNITWWIFSLLFLICCGATLHHFIRLLYQQNTNENGKVPSSFLFDFSFIESTKTLLKFDRDNKLNYIHFLKIITMLPIIWGHKIFVLMSNPVSNPKYMENIYHNGPVMLLTSLNAVDPFFFLSGFIMYKNLLREFQKPKTELVWKTLSLPIIKRIIRLVPAYCAMMAITAHMVPHHGDGPLWPYQSWEEAEICKNYWWTNLLFISNFVDIKHQCLYMSWYLSCDIQFFIIGTIVVYVYTKNPNYGIALLGTIIGVSISVPFIITLSTGRDGMDKFLIPHLLYTRNILSLNESYRPSYMRATPFFVGLAISCIVEKLIERKVKFSQITVYGGLFAICTLTLWTQFYGSIFYTRDRPYYPFEHALYSTICHCTWPVAGIWITISYFTSGFGLLESLVNNRLFVIMGKLSYTVLLVNITVLFTSQSSQRLPVHLTPGYVFEAFLYDAFKSYFMAIILYLVVDEPFAKLTNRLFYQRKNISSSINTRTLSNKPATHSSKSIKND